MIGEAIGKITGKIAAGQKAPRQPQPVGAVPASTATASAGIGANRDFGAINPLDNDAITNRGLAIDAYKAQFGSPGAMEAAGGSGNWMRQQQGTQAYKDFVRNYAPPAATTPAAGPVSDAATGAASGYSNNNSTGTQYIAGGGLLSKAGNKLTINSSTTGSAINPVTRTITPDELAYNQLIKYMDQDSELNQINSTKGLQVANARGLLNSGQAVELSRKAVIEGAQPFVLADSARYGQVADKNMDAQNEFKLADKKFNFDLDLQSNEQAWRTGENTLDRKLTSSEGAANRAADLARTSMGIAADDARFDKDIAFRTGESALDRSATSTENQAQRDFTAGENDETRAFDRESQIKAAEIAADASLTQHLYQLGELGYRFELDKYSVSKTYAANVMSELSAGINTILADPNLDETAKKNAIDNRVAVTNDMLKFGSTLYGTAVPYYGTVNGQTTTGGTVNTASPSAPAVIVNSVYQKLVGKAPDQEGLTYWSNLAQQNGWNEAQLEQAIRSTPEYQAYAATPA